MRKILLKIHNKSVGILYEQVDGYSLEYILNYVGVPLSLALPIEKSKYEFTEFPPFLDGLLPEGNQLDALLRKYKIDSDDYLTQIILVGKDLVGAITVEEII